MKLLNSAAALAVAGAAIFATGQAVANGRHPKEHFRRIAALPNYANNAYIAEETVSEILAAPNNGKILAYTDGVHNAVGFVAISDPRNPRNDS